MVGKPVNMIRFFNSDMSANDTIVRLDAAESHHAKNVLRLREGECVGVLNGKGLEITGTLEFEGKRHVKIRTRGVRYVEKPVKSCILGFAVTESRDTDALIIRSSVELGVTGICNLISRYCGYRKCGDTDKFIRRRHRILTGACKQSGHLWLPELTGPLPLEDFLEGCRNTVRVFAGWEPGLGEMVLNHSAFPESSDGFVWVVGPEGGWSREDLNIMKTWGVFFIRLGTHTLTTPVAAVAGLAALKTSIGDWRPFLQPGRTPEYEVY
jgi:16S rRNA (uracil1498-N3)-methyltransferase